MAEDDDHRGNDPEAVEDGVPLANAGESTVRRLNTTGTSHAVSGPFVVATPRVVCSAQAVRSARAQGPPTWGARLARLPYPTAAARRLARGLLELQRRVRVPVATARPRRRGRVVVSRAVWIDVGRGALLDATAVDRDGAPCRVRPAPDVGGEVRRD